MVMGYSIIYCVTSLVLIFISAGIGGLGIGLCVICLNLFQINELFI